MKTGILLANIGVFSAFLAGLIAPAPAFATLVITAAPTEHITCSFHGSDYVCRASDKNAVLNRDDLETFLAAENVQIKTLGDAQATDIQVTSSLGWTTSYVLTLDAHRSISIGSQVYISGAGSLVLLTNDGGTGGTLSFVDNGNVAFANLSSSLVINGVSYLLMPDVKSLANNILGYPSGNYALARDYDAAGDGTYTSAPIPTPFTGTFEGLGNSISHLSINDYISGDSVGLFAQIGSSSAAGAVRDVGLVSAKIRGSDSATVGGIAGNVGNASTVAGSYVKGSVSGKVYSTLGGLVGYNSSSTITSSYSTANVKGVGDQVAAGGLAGYNYGSIVDSYATGAVLGSTYALLGGLVGENGGTVSVSFATGKVTGRDLCVAGGLVGEDLLPGISNSYATGTVTENSGNGSGALLGGLAGYSLSPISDSYSTGAVTGSGADVIGGLLGYDDGYQKSDTYWDTTTSGITDPSQGAGNIPNDPGITGLSNTQLQSGLPSGFSSKIWAEKAGINGGIPYLRANPPK